MRDMDGPRDTGLKVMNRRFKYFGQPCEVGIVVLKIEIYPLASVSYL